MPAEDLEVSTIDITASKIPSKRTGEFVLSSKKISLFSRFIFH